MTFSDRTLYSYLILGIALLAFVTATIFDNFNIGLICLLVGMIIWLFVTIASNTEGQNSQIGVVMITAGFIGGLIVFIRMGMRPNVFGGHVLHIEGVVMALVVLLIFVAIGLGFLGLANLEKKLAFFNKELKKLYKLYMKEDNE
ncbi:MAG TPA: hypothetical protein P5268_09690 [Candidatus Marinimicrobia bacterium]|nr:hypothetical protein [Candidatus Neomarinimicrobiota bacterium]HRS52374.1 hypothetical protein [Candidatus Neomarinimicrobiota bacterium]HRU93283.1 hypothetical protein [Candidatus Neomarinimicrobiota bacterium]